MAKTNAIPVQQPLPTKIETRLADLLALGEFDLAEVTWCRRAYWAARADWHQILIDCHARALARSGAASGRAQ